MNKENLAIIFDQYITRFDEFNGAISGDRDEGYKWEAVSCFKKNWDIDAEDFKTMFKASMSKTGFLIDGSRRWPTRGIAKLLERQDKVELVRQCFRELFSDDNGDLDARMDRVYTFRDKINQHIDDKQWGYRQRHEDVIGYLNLWKPEENYFYGFNVANKWANCIEFGDDFWNSGNVSLKKYYRMCDELLDEVSKNNTIMELNQSRFERTAHGFDDKLHILVYDIMYCNSNDKLYEHIGNLPTSIKERIRKADLNDHLDEATAIYEEAIREKEEAEMQVSERPVNLIGKEVKHKQRGIGTVISQIDKVSTVDGKPYTIIEINFDSGNSRFPYADAFGDGYLVALDDELASSIRFDIATRENLAKAEKNLATAKAEYEKCLAATNAN